MSTNPKKRVLVEESGDRVVVDFDETGRYCCSLVYSITGQKIKVFEKETNALKFDLNSPVKESLESVSFLTTDKAYASLQPLALLSSSGNIYIYSLVEETVKLSLLGGHKTSVTCIVSGKNHISTASKDGTISVWHKSDGSLINTFRGENKNISNLKLVKQSSLLLSTSNNLKVWSTKKFELEKEIPAHTTNITSLLVSEKHQVCFTAASQDRFIGVISLDKKPIHHPGFTIDEEVVQLNLVNKHLVAVLASGKVAVWVDCLQSQNSPRPPTTKLQLKDSSKVSVPVVKTFSEPNQNYLLAAVGDTWNLKFESMILENKYSDKVTTIEVKGGSSGVIDNTLEPSTGAPKVIVGSAIPAFDTSNSLMTLGERVTQTNATNVPLANPTDTTSVPTMKDSVSKLLTQAIQANDNDLLKSILGTTVNRQIVPTVQELPSIFAPALLAKLCSETSTSFLKQFNHLLWLKALLTYHNAYLQSNPSVTAQLTSFLEVANLKLESTESLAKLKHKLMYLNEKVMERDNAPLKVSGLVYSEKKDEVFKVEDLNSPYQFHFKKFRGGVERV